MLQINMMVSVGVRNRFEISRTNILRWQNTGSAFQEYNYLRHFLKKTNKTYDLKCLVLTCLITYLSQVIESCKNNFKSYNQL